MSIKVVPKNAEGQGLTSKEFDELRHFFFSGLLEQSYQRVALKHGDEKFYGDLLSVTFIIDKKETKQRYKFSKHDADTTLKPEQEKEFCKLININLETERKVCRTIFVMLDMVTSVVHITKNFDNGEKDVKTI